MTQPNGQRVYVVFDWANLTASFRLIGHRCLVSDTKPYYSYGVRVTGKTIADNGLALEARGDFERAASFYERAATVYLTERAWGDAAEMRRRALTCRRVTPVR